jgi:hypothetical protein
MPVLERLHSRSRPRVKPGYRSAEQSIVPEMKADLSLTNYLFFRL